MNRPWWVPIGMLLVACAGGSAARRPPPQADPNPKSPEIHIQLFAFEAAPPFAGAPALRMVLMDVPADYANAPPYIMQVPDLKSDDIVVAVDGESVQGVPTAGSTLTARIQRMQQGDPAIPSVTLTVVRKITIKP